MGRGGGVGGVCVCGGGRVGTQHSEGMGKQRWQVEVRAEQFSTVGVEVQRGTGVEGGAGVRAGIIVVRETVICPRPGPYPQSSMVLLSLPLLLGFFFLFCFVCFFGPFPLNVREEDRFGASM